MNPYLKFVEDIQATVESARGLTAAGKNPPVESENKAVLFSPHPDDECITGLLPLRLMREAGMQILNVPVTFGSNVERRPGRAAELQNACDYLGWDILKRNHFQPLEKSDVVEILKDVEPQILFVPYSRDWNLRHISTHHLVMDALVDMPAGFSCTVIETEYWGTMEDPNLMVQGDAKTVADLVAATSLHVGEVSRNPYHLLLPAWMQDNVRRGGELVGGQGGTVPEFHFATLSRLSRWENGRLVRGEGRGRMVGMSDNLKELFEWK